jgi:superfamily II DNA or RNA helicase
MSASDDLERARLLVNALDEAAQAFMDQVAPRDAVRGQGAVESIGECTWDPSNWTLTAVFGDGSGPRLRLIFNPESAETPCMVVCSCANPFCFHGYALANVLVEALAGSHHLDYMSDLAASVRTSFGQESWRHGLERLRHIAGDGESEDEDDPNGPAVRAVFRLVDKKRRGQLRLSMQCYLQERSNSNETTRWSLGKRIPWTQWSQRPQLQRDPLSDAVERMVSGHLRDEPRQARFSLGAIENEDWLPTASLLVELVGSTRVSWLDDPRRTLAIERGSLKIEVLDDAHFVRVVIWLGKNELSHLGHVTRTDARHLAYVDRDRRHLVVSPSLPANLVQGLASLLLSERRFPRNELPSLMQNLTRLCGGHRCSVLAIDPQLETMRESGDPRPRVELEALSGGGIGLRIVAAPDEMAQTFEPGEGAGKLHVARGREFTTIYRDLALERKNALELAQTLGLEVGDDAFDRRANWGWTLVDVQQSLECLAKLRELGERVRLFWYGGPIRISPIVDTAALVLRINRRPGWFDFNGGVEVENDKLVSLKHLLEAAVAGRRFVEVGPNRWLSLSKDLIRHLRTIDDFTQAKGNGRTLSDFALPAFSDLLDPQIEIDACAEWKKRSAQVRAAQSEEETPILGLHAELRPYQREGIRWLRRMSTLGLGACLADDMGLGKTVQTLALLVDRAKMGPALVVAPLSVTDNWAAEGRRFAPGLDFILYRGSARIENLALGQANQVFIMSYAVFQRDAKALNQCTWSTLVLDEAQAIKNPTTKVARAARDLPASWKLALTGTPLENRLSDLWSLYRVLTPGLLGSLEYFNSHFVTPIERYDDRRRAAALSRLVRPYLLRRTKSQVLQDLPALSEGFRLAKPDAEERELYELHRRKIVERLKNLDKSSDQRMSVLAALTELRQLACHPSLVIDRWKRSSAKLDLLLEIVEELAQAGHAALIFSQFTRHLDLIERGIKAAGKSTCRLDGTLSPAQRTKAIDAFQNGEHDFMLISLKAGGTGLNLTRASYVILCDPWWNPAVEDQAAGRAHRIGQVQNVHRLRLITKGTVEERVLDIHADKRELVESMLESAGQSAKIEMEELIALLHEGSREHEDGDEWLAARTMQSAMS